MIEQIEQIIEDIGQFIDGDECFVREDGNRLLFVPWGNGWPSWEVHWFMEWVEGVYKLKEVQRNNEYLLFETREQKLALAALMVLYKKQFEEIHNAPVVKKIYTLMDENNISAVEKLIAENVDPKYYSIGKEIADRISLVYNGVCYSLRYSGYDIIDDADITQGYVAMFNFAYLLQLFDEFFPAVAARFGVEDHYKDLRLFYLFTW